MYKAEANKSLTQIPEIQLKLNVHYNAFQKNNPFVTVLGCDTTLALDRFPHLINKYQLAMERHNATSQALTNAKASQVKKANLHHTLEPQHKVGDKVLLSTNNIYIKIVLPKMKPPRTGPFIILSPN